MAYFDEAASKLSLIKQHLLGDLSPAIIQNPSSLDLDLDFDLKPELIDLLTPTPKPQPSPVDGPGSLSANSDRDKFDLFANLHFGSRNRNNSHMSLHQRLPSNS